VGGKEIRRLLEIHLKSLEDLKGIDLTG